MKTKFTLIASIIFLSALITAFVPANGQRRSTNSEVVKNRSEQKENNSTVRKNKPVVNEDSKNKIQNSTSNGRRTSTQKKESRPAAETSSPEVNKRGNSASQERKVYQQPTQKRNDRSTAVQRRIPESNRSNIKNAPARNERESIRSNSSSRQGSSAGGAVTPRARKEHNRTIYRVDSKDNRYAPTKTYKGNNNNWSSGYARHHVHYNTRDENFYRYYDHRKYMHWDHTWESYSWNVNSWRDYYSGYHPYSYRFHKHYYFHPGYGHVVRKFGYKTDFFVHNNVRYFNYNGHFFRHFPGVGYVLVDMPYGLVFQKLPRHIERVYINGYLYFRAGNLFFERNPYGYALIHYPERYFALENDYYNGGYYREGDYFIRH